MKSVFTSFMLFTCLIIVALLSIGLVSTTAWATVYTSTATGNWSTMAWSPAGTPGASDDVIIADGTIVTINQAITITNLIVGQGVSGKLTFDGTAVRAVSITGNLTIAAGGTFITQALVAPIGDVATASTTITNVTPDPTTTAIAVGMTITGTGIPASTTIVSWTNNSITVSAAATANGTAAQFLVAFNALSTLALGGNLTNNGTFDMSQLVGFAALPTCLVTFNNTTGDQIITGATPVLTRFRGITLAKAAVGNRVVCNIDVSKSGSGVLLFTAGTWEQTAGTFTFSNGNEVTFLPNANASLVISGSGSLWDGGASLTITGGNITCNTTGTFLQGSGNNALTVTTGTLNLLAGTVTLNGRLTMTAGTTTITNANITINQQVGAVTATGGNNAFDLTAAANFNMSGGSVTFGAPNAAATDAARTGRDLKIAVPTTGVYNITGGTFFIGDGNVTPVSGSTGYTISCNTPTALRNLVIQGGGVTGRNVLMTANLIVNGTLSMRSGTINLSGKTITYGASAALKYDGTTALATSLSEWPTVGGPANVIMNNAAGITLDGSKAISGTLTLTSGNIITGANTLAAAGTIGGASSSSYVEGKLARVYTVPGSLTFPIGKGGIYRPLSLNYTALTGTSTVTAEQFETGFPGVPPLPATQVGTRYWNVSQSGGSAYAYDITLDGTGMSFSGSPQILKHDAGTTIAVGATSPNYTATGLTSLSDFAFGQAPALPIHNITQNTFYGTMQAAVDAANPGDVISVAAGTYDESVDIQKPLSLLGQGAATTIIDRSANATAGTVISIHNFAGNLTFDGFTVKTGPSATVISNGVHISNLTGAGTITISNNEIWGVQSATQTALDNYTVIAGYFSATAPKLVFDHNVVHGGSDNPILIEKWMGPTEITNNTLYQNPLKDFSASDVIFMMNYADGHNTQKQLISGNTFDMGWGTTNQRGAGISIAAAYTGGTALGGFTDVEIVNNVLTNMKPNRRGISLWNNSTDGPGGDITNAIIARNTISNAPTFTGEFGIRVLGKATGTQIINNFVSGVGDAVRIQPYNGHEPTNSVVSQNSLSAATLLLNNGTSVIVNASGNWWGGTDASVVLPLLAGSVDFTPMLASGTDADLVTAGFQPDLSVMDVHAAGSQTGTTPRIQEGVDLVSGSTVNVAAGSYHEQVYINKNLTLHGAGALTTTVAPPPTLMSQPFLPDRTDRPIIGVGPLGTNVTLEGFTVDGEGAGNLQAGMTGIQYFKASGIIRNNTITHVRKTPFDGTQGFLGIFVGHTNNVAYTHSVEINNNTVVDYGKLGIVCNEEGLTANIHHNTVTGQGPTALNAQNGIQIGWGATGTIAHNTISAISYTGPSWSASGIVLPASGGVVDINNNTVTDAQVGVYPSQVGGYPFGCNITMASNTISASTVGVGISDYYGLVTYSVGTALRPVDNRKSLRSASPLPPSPFDMSESRRADGRMSPMTAMTATLTGNTITNTSPAHVGVGAYLLALETSPMTVSLTDNTISGWEVAVVTDKDAGATLTSTLRHNALSGNSWGMYDFTSVLQDAKENWWGNAAGPNDGKTLPGTPNYTNPTGLGDSVSSYVDYSPFYIDAARTTLSIYTLTVTSVPGAGGSVVKTPDQPTYNHATVVSLQANANPGYHFVNWTGDVTSAINPLALTMTGSKNVTANFAMDAITTFPYTQNFDAVTFPPSGWSQSGTPGWSRQIGKFHSAPACAGVVYTPAGSSYLVSPAFALPASHRVKFWWNDHDPDYAGPLTAGHDTTWFEISTNAGTTWITLGTLSRAAAVDQWDLETHDLSAYAGTVLLRWRDWTDGSGFAYGTGVDDVLIEAIPTNVAPGVAYTTISSTSNGAAITLTATITDDFGVDSSLAGSPRLWYRSGATIPLAGSYASITGTRTAPGANTWSFALPALPPLTFVEYYVAAQDDDATTLVVTNPVGTSYAVDPPNGTVASPNRFVVASPLTFTVGTAGANFPSITEGLTWLYGGIDGPVELLLNSDYTSVGEVPPIYIGGITGMGAAARSSNVGSEEVSANRLSQTEIAIADDMSAYRVRQREFAQNARQIRGLGTSTDALLVTNTFTIKPNTAATPGPISGVESTYGGVIYVGGNGVHLENLTVQNSGTLAAVLVTDGASNGVIKNCVLKANVTAGNAVGVVWVYDGGDFNVIDNCDLTHNGLGAFNGVTYRGVSPSPVMVGDTLKNSRFLNFAYTGGTSQGGNGVWVLDGTNGLVIEGNDISMTAPTPGFSTATYAGILVGSSAVNPVTNTFIRNNTIHDIDASGSSGLIAGISAGSGTNVLGALVEGNTVSTLGATASAATGVRGFYVAAGLNQTFARNTVKDLHNTLAGGAVIGFRISGAAGGQAFKTTWVNNMITLGNTGTNGNIGYLGISDNGNTDDTAIVAFNSIYIGGVATGGTTAAYNRSAASMVTLRNNILMNERDGGAGFHYGIRSTPVSGGVFSSDYNDIYVTGATNGAFGAFAGVNQATLAAWQTASGGDAASKNADPLFVDATIADLHIKSDIGDMSPTANAGVVYGGVTVDIDNQTGKRATTPDIGADEFNMRAPVAFSQLTPANGATAQPLAGSLTWDAMPLGATAFDVYLDLNASPVTLLAGNITATTTPYSGLMTDSTYYWKVAAKNSDSSTVATGAPWNFKTILSTVNVNVSLLAGWNMISNPVTASNDSVRVLYPTSEFDHVYAFDSSNGYLVDRTMENRTGYWGRFPDATVHPVNGFPRTLDSISVAAGWNMVGSISFPVDTGMVVSDPPGIRLSPWFEYNAGYNHAGTIMPGSSYWVKADGTGKFILAGGPVATRSSKHQAAKKGSNRSVNDVLNTITITDSRGGSQTLYFGVDARNEIPAAFHSMPPMPPLGAFDARFVTRDGGAMVQTHAKVSEAVEFPVMIQSAAYPLTVKWNVNKGTATYALTGAFGSKEMTGEGTMNITSSEVTRISVKLVGDGSLPKEFSLSQNYPNPFNPSTQVKYGLPVDSRVTVDIYNIIGQKVRTLVADNQVAGYHTAEWNGLNNEGQQLSSGVYFLQMSAKGANGKSFNEIKKLMLMK